MQTELDKKVCLIFIVVVIIIVLVIFQVINAAKTDNYRLTNRHIINTEYQDKFLIKEAQIGNWPEPYYNVEIYDANLKSGKELILKLDKVEMDDKEISPFYSSPEIKCYLVSGYIMFKSKEQKSFKVLQTSQFIDLDVNENRCLIPIARQFLLQNWWHSREVSEFLLKSGDIESIAIIKRYAKGEFTEEELRHNMYSPYSKEEMQKYLTDLLVKQNIELKK